MAKSCTSWLAQQINCPTYKDHPETAQGVNSRGMGGTHICACMQKILHVAGGAIRLGVVAQPGIVAIHLHRFLPTQREVRPFNEDTYACAAATPINHVKNDLHLYRFVVSRFSSRSTETVNAIAGKSAS